MTRDPILSAALSDAGIVLLEHVRGAEFELLSGSTPWFSAALGVHEPGARINLRGAFPLLDHFLPLARDHWAFGDPSETITSGFWMEEILGGEVPLEATATRVEGRALLTFRSPTHTFAETRSALQRARESLLHNEVLESAVRDRTEMIRAREEEIAVRLVSAAEFRDSATGEHIRRIGKYTCLLAEAMGLPRDTIDHLELAAAMHDVGKIGIPDHILLKPGPLDESEMRIMRRHTTMGANILDGSDTKALQLGREIALSHHEKWDGSGYPFGLSGEQIPLSGRIVAVVDFFDALVNDRPYRTALPVEEVLAIMATERSRHFDPQVLDLFMVLQPQIEQIRIEVDLRLDTALP